MHTTQLRQADLNLLVVLAVLVEERSVSAAAERLLLSQPAVSRSLKRLQDMFDDPLLIRSRKGYDLTVHGERIMKELEVVLPRIDRLLRGREFDPKNEKATFKIASNDYAFRIFGNGLSKRIISKDNQISLEFVAWSDTIYHDVEQGRNDIALTADHGSATAHFSREKIFKDELVCIVSKESAFKSKMTLKTYSEAEHVMVSLYGREQTILDRQLSKIGVKRKFRMRVPYFSSAIDVAAGTNLIATVPARLADDYLGKSLKKNEIRIIPSPAEIDGFQLFMTWHPRFDQDAAHSWLREQVRSTAKQLR